MITLLYIYSFCWFFTYFEPWQKLLDVWFQKLPDNNYTDQIYTIIGCQKCFTFWFTLAITLNPFIAMGLSMVADLHKKITNKLK